MTRHEKTWPTWAILLMVASAATTLQGCDLLNPLTWFSSNDSSADESSDTTVPSDSGLPFCEKGKVDDGTPCRHPEADGGVASCDTGTPDPDSGSQPDAGVPTEDGGEASPDAETPPADAGTPDSGSPPEQCPPPSIPNGTDCDGQCKIYWSNSTGHCLSDCQGVFYPPSSPDYIALACGLGVSA